MKSSDNFPVNPRHVIWAVCISMTVSAWLIYSNFSLDAFRTIRITDHLWLGLLFAALTVFLRDAAYVYRIRLLTDNKLSWRASVELVLLWEYGSAATPATTGGMALSLLAFGRQGISAGRGTALILLAKFFDDLAFVLVFTGLFFVLGSNMLVVAGFCPDLDGQPVMQAVRALGNKAWIGYVTLLLLCAFLGTAIFILPHHARRVLYRLSRLRGLNRFEKKICFFADEIEIAAHEFRHRPPLFFVRMFVSTTISWIARYALANALIFAFATQVNDQLVVFARQFLLWVFLMLPSTPGASGVAEVSFMAMNCEFIPAGLSGAVVLVWRMFNYYLYLIAGVWLLRQFLMRKKPL